MVGPTPPVRPDALVRPHPERFAPSDIGYEPGMQAHRVAVRRGEAGYLDPTTGLFVMTAAYLIERGYCCDRGCRHCPWLS